MSRSEPHTGDRPVRPVRPRPVFEAPDAVYEDHGGSGGHEAPRRPAAAHANRSRFGWKSKLATLAAFAVGAGVGGIYIDTRTYIGEKIFGQGGGSSFSSNLAEQATLIANDKPVGNIAGLGPKVLPRGASAAAVEAYVFAGQSRAGDYSQYGRAVVACVGAEASASIDAPTLLGLSAEFALAQDNSRADALRIKSATAAGDTCVRILVQAANRGTAEVPVGFPTPSS